MIGQSTLAGRGLAGESDVGWMLRSTALQTTDNTLTYEDCVVHFTQIVETVTPGSAPFTP